MPNPNQPTPNLPDALTPEARAVRDAYAALNRGDIAGFTACLHPDIVRVEPAGFPMSGTYEGIDAVTAHITAARGTWAEGMGHDGTTDEHGNPNPEPTGCIPTRIHTAGDRVVVIVDVNVRLANEAEFRTGRLADVFVFKDGKATEFRTFADVDEALRSAGITPGETG